ncbi:hypothetical protein LBK6_11030 [Leptospira borgpetersenii serovar Hardjo]|nr:hypothetical protein LBK6_11030 [Leptospira borgpetersenii serovar Hardjo]AWV70636.1 hypothetical protein B9T54_11910 [Leptospira borgpetersenii serovar Hardjo-bovis]TQE54048.1 hypothetical protein FFZ95_05170 [Leptospira borgpetersenii]AMX62100.1 hypothetical protein LBK9_11070 [Leptospira borgpetersenii serovar Hardjo]AMX65343.1 hypothetical protein LBK30_11090 [Leptospira borgpetersenii serovar Hardjo]
MLSSWEIELLNNTFLRVLILNYYFDPMRRRNPFWEQKWEHPEKLAVSVSKSYPARQIQLHCKLLYS